MNSHDQIVRSKDLLVYVGTYTGGGSKGIYYCQLDLSNGELRQVGSTRKVENPSYLAVDAERLRLYAVNERLASGEQSGGRVSAFSIQPSSGELSLINQQSSRGGAPCYLALDYSGRFLYVTNYLGGNAVVFPIAEEGALGEPADIVAHSGSSLITERQEGPHPHSIVLDKANNYAFVPDLGLDKVMQYRIEPDTGRLLANRPPWVEANPGSGPRHMVFQQGMKLAYVINELSSTVTVYAYDSSRGTLRPLQTISTLPQGYVGTNIAADLHLTPNGRFLYGSNRGHDSIACYSVEQETGSLTYLDCTPTLGKRPRGFAIDPSGTFMLVANQDSHNIVTFWIDDRRGTIIPTGHRLRVPSPVCLKFLSIEAS